MVFAVTPEKKAMEKEAPVNEERWANLVNGLAMKEIFLVQLSASIKLAKSRPIEI
jgi:hypothetical protein